MVEPSDRPCLVLEPGQPPGIAGERFGQHLECYVTPEPRVLRAIHLAHAARPERREDLVGAEAGTAGHHHRPNLPQAQGVAVLALTARGPKSRRRPPWLRLVDRDRQDPRIQPVVTSTRA